MVNKILFVVNQYAPDNVGGAEVTVQILAEELRRRGTHVTIVTLSPTADDTSGQVNGIPVYRSAVANLYYPYGREQPALARLIWHARDVHNARMAEKVGRIIDVQKPDWVSTHNLSGFSVAVWEQVKQRGLGLSHMLHDYYLLCPRTSMFKKGKNCETQCFACRLLSHRKRSVSGQVDLVIGISRYVLDAHIRRVYFPRARTAVIHNARPLSSASAELPRARDKAILRIGYIGRIEAEKGIETVLQAVSRLVPKTWQLSVAGRSPSIAYLNDLKRRYAHSEIRYVGFVESSEFYKQLDVLVVPSLWHEALGNVAFEAMEFGIPVVASRSGGLPEIIEGSDVGWLFEPGDDAALARILAVIATKSDQQSHEMRQRAQVRHAHFLPARQADEFLAAIEATRIEQDR